MKTERTRRRNTVIVKVGDFNTSLPIFNRTGRLKISKDREDLINMMHQLNQIDIYQIIHPTTAKYTFLSNPHRIFIKVDYVPGLKTSVNKFKRIHITQSILSDHNRIKLEIKSNISGKYPNT